MQREAPRSKSSNSHRAPSIKDSSASIAWHEGHCLNKLVRQKQELPPLCAATSQIWLCLFKVTFDMSKSQNNYGGVLVTFGSRLYTIFMTHLTPFYSQNPNIQLEFEKPKPHSLSKLDSRPNSRLRYNMNFEVVSILNVWGSLLLRHGNPLSFVNHSSKEFFKWFPT